MSIHELIESIKTLSPSDRQHLQKVLGEMSAEEQDQTAKVSAFHRSLLTAGLVTEIKTPRRTKTTDRQLIEISGKPLSKTIIEERR